MIRRRMRGHIGAGFGRAATAVVACVAIVGFLATRPAAAAVQAPQIAQQPADLALTVGSDAFWTAAVTGDNPMKISTEVSRDGGKTWAVWSSCTGACSGAGSQEWEDVTLAMNGWEFRVVGTNAGGTAVSRAASLRVCAGPPNQTCPP